MARVTSESARLRLSPAVRRLVKEHGVDVTQIAGSGRAGRVTFRDASAYLEARGESAAGSAPADVEPLQTSSAGLPPTGIRRVPHSPMRRRIAEHMVESMLRTAPHVTAAFEADLSAVVTHRAAHKGAFASRGARLTYTAYFVAAAVRALQSVPEVNSRWRDDALEIFADCNIGVATAVDAGLVVPVIRKAQSLSLFGTAERLQELTTRARRGRLERSEMEGGTFTLTNHGVSGSLIATPIINQPQSAILGLGKLEKRVVVREAQGADAIVIRPMIYVTLTIDHRALDGFQANAFLSRFVQVLETWE